MSARTSSPAPVTLRAVAPAPTAADAGLRVPALVQRFAAIVRDRALPALQLGVRRLGAAGTLGLALLIASAVLVLSSRASLVAEIVRLDRTLASTPTAGHVPVVAPRASVAGLPPRSTLPSALRDIAERAEQAGLTLPSGKYEIAPLPAAGFVRYRVDLPVHGEYPQVRAFVDAVLGDLPFVAVTGLTIGRKAVGDAGVDADVRLTLFLKEPR